MARHRPHPAARRGANVMARRAAVKRYAPDAFGLARCKDIGTSAALSLHGFAAVDNTTMLALTDAQLAHLATAATGRIAGAPTHVKAPREAAMRPSQRASGGGESVDRPAGRSIQNDSGLPQGHGGASGAS